MKKTLTVQLSSQNSRHGFFYLAFQFLFLPSLLRTLFSLLDPGVSDATINFSYYLINFVAIFLIFRHFLLAQFQTTVRHRLPVLLCTVSGLFLYWLCTFLLSGLTLLLLPDFINVNDAGIAAISRNGYFLMALGTVLLVPTVEETLFRGLIFGRLYSQSRLLAYGVSALCFCFIHISGYLGLYPLPLLAVCFIQYLPAGLILAWSYARSDSLLTPILIHTVINAIGIFSMR